MTPEQKSQLEKAEELMSDKGYEEGSLDNAQFKEIQEKYHELWDNWKANKDIG